MKQSIYKIAKAANVSPTTVSRVLNGRPGVSASTRERILTVIDQTQYSPSIAKNTNSNIGVFMGSQNSNKYVADISSYCSKIISGLGSVFYNYGYCLSLLPVHVLPKTKDDFKIFCFKKQITAAVFFNITIDDIFITEYTDIIPIACIGTKFPLSGPIYAKANNYQGTCDAVQYLLNMHHKNIGMIHPDRNIQDHNDRLCAYNDTLQKNGIMVRPENILEFSDVNSSDFIYSLSSLFNRPLEERVSALIICDDRTALKIPPILDELHMHIPEDISVICYEDMLSPYCQPPLTTVLQPTFELGRQTALTLISALRGESAITQDIFLDTRLIIRKSVKEFIAD